MTIQRGDVIQLGPHRLMCGDSTDPMHVKRLLGTDVPDMIFCSPPYLEQRTYDTENQPWDSLMRSFIAACKYKPDTQAFVNLGLVHRNHEWIDYWHDWAHWMSSQGWQKRGWYVWDKLDGIPTVPLHGRLYNCHEFVFHFSRGTKIPRKTTACKHAGTKVKSISMTGRQGIIKKHLPNALTVQSHRIADSVTRVSNRGKRMKGQVAHFPIGLPSQYIESFSSEGEIVHDPFCGSGTTIVAADTIGRVAYGMEISPNYCQIAVDRYWRHKEKQKA